MPFQIKRLSCSSILDFLRLLRVRNQRCQRGVQLLTQTIGKVGHKAQFVGDPDGHFACRERQLRMQEQSGDGRFHLSFNGHGRGFVSQCLLALAAMKGRTDFPNESGCACESEVDLQRNGKSRVFPDRFSGGGVALGQRLVQNDHTFEAEVRFGLSIVAGSAPPTMSRVRLMAGPARAANRFRLVCSSQARSPMSLGGISSQYFAAFELLAAAVGKSRAKSICAGLPPGVVVVFCLPPKSANRSTSRRLAAATILKSLP